MVQIFKPFQLEKDKVTKHVLFWGRYSGHCESDDVISDLLLECLYQVSGIRFAMMFCVCSREGVSEGRGRERERERERERKVTESVSKYPQFESVKPACLSTLFCFDCY